MDTGSRPGTDAPAPPAIPPGKRWNKAREAIFFEELARTCNVGWSARKAGMSPQSAYRRRDSVPGFAADWLRALDIGFAELEMQLLRHALHGCERVEVTTDGTSGKVTQTRTIHFYPHHVALRMMQAHRGTVERFRTAERAQLDDAEMLARIEAEMDRVHDRLAEEDRERAEAAGWHG